MIFTLCSNDFDFSSRVVQFWGLYGWGNYGNLDNYKSVRNGYLDDYGGYNGELKYVNDKTYNGDSLEDEKFEKYDGPNDYIISNQYRDDNKENPYGRLGSDIREYDYVAKCDNKEKDCKDGRDCYDKANDRAGYDKCRDQYGDEGRYYDDNDRYSSNRYRYNNRDSYDNDCYDNNKDRNDYEKCRQYYRKFRENNKPYYRYSYNEQDWKSDRDCYFDNVNLVGLDKDDREDQLIRPCALDDRQCIRKYLAKNSGCKPAYGPIPDPVYFRRNTMYFTFANLTLIFTRLRLTGLSSIKISEFYVNKDTGNLVIALDFKKLNLTSPRGYFRYKRTAKESIVLSDFATVEFTSGTFTAVIPKIPNLRLDLAEVHADIDNSIPPFFIGPRVTNSTDPDVVTGFARFLSDIPTAVQETFLFQSQLFTSIYIQENICDFGFKLVSV